jgi:MEMO1 family protein
MRLIEEGDPAAFQAYLKQHHNTICGRHPVAVFMHALVAHRARTGQGLRVRFVRYAQSSRCRSKQDSSVSYASAVAREEGGADDGGGGGGGGGGGDGGKAT